jgi:hypothetical protein
MGSCNIMGNTKTLNIIRGKDKIKWAQHMILIPSINTVLFCTRHMLHERTDSRC